MQDHTPVSNCWSCSLQALQAKKHSSYSSLHGPVFLQCLVHYCFTSSVCNCCWGYSLCWACWICHSHQLAVLVWNRHCCCWNLQNRQVHSSTVATFYLLTTRLWYGKCRARCTFCSRNGSLIPRCSGGWSCCRSFKIQFEWQKETPQTIQPNTRFRLLLLFSDHRTPPDREPCP